MTHAFSKTSLDRLSTCHPDIQKVMMEAIKYSPVDFGISHGHRTPQEQNELYQKGRTTPGEIVTYKDGFKEKSKHNESPSMAVDIYCWPREIMYDMQHLCVVGGVVMATAARLYEEGKINSRVVWGNDWNHNGVLIIKDGSEKFVDAPHYQI